MIPFAKFKALQNHNERVNAWLCAENSAVYIPLYTHTVRRGWFFRGIIQYPRADAVIPKHSICTGTFEQYEWENHHRSTSQSTHTRRVTRKREIIKLYPVFRRISARLTRCWCIFFSCTRWVDYSLTLLVWQRFVCERSYREKSMLKMS